MPLFLVSFTHITTIPAVLIYFIFLMIGTAVSQDIRIGSDAYLAAVAEGTREVSGGMGDVHYWLYRVMFIYLFIDYFIH